MAAGLDISLDHIDCSSGAGEHWKKPFFWTLALHLLTMGLALLPASLFEPNLNIEEVYTVDLFEVMEERSTQPASTPSPPQVKPELPKPVQTPVEQNKPVQSKPVVSEVSIPAPAPVPAIIISLKPRLRKKKLRIEKKELTQQEKNKLNQALEKIQTRVKAEKAEEKAHVAVQDALAQLRASIHTSQPRVSASSSRQSSAPSTSTAGHGRSAVMDETLKRYYLDVSRQIHQFWILPELQEWPSTLTAIYVVHVRRDGIVKKNYMEKKSDDLYFNQFVEKTIQQALPLPPFPDELNETELEIGLVFHPSGLE